MYEWDNNKNKKNAEKHGVSFGAMEGFDWDTALVVEDARSIEPR
ncbi:BrnT family toxin [Nitrincola sp.]